MNTNVFLLGFVAYRILKILIIVQFLLMNSDALNRYYLCIVLNQRLMVKFEKKIKSP